MKSSRASNNGCTKVDANEIERGVAMSRRKRRREG